MGWRGSANSFGGVTWPLIGGLLGGISWHMPFAVYLLGLPLGFLALITIPETHRENISGAGKEGSVLKVFRNNPVLFVLYGLLFWMMILLYAIVVFVPQLLEKIDISNPFYISLYISTMGLSAGLTSLMYGRIKARLSYKRIVLIALALWAVGFTMISRAASGFIIAASVALFGIGQGMLAPAVRVWVGEVVPLAFRGRIVSYLGTFGFGGQFLSPILFGPVALLLGLNGVFLVAGGTSALLFLLFFIGKKS